MTVTPDDFIASAKESLKAEHEIDHRNSASRAYYSMYHACNIFANKANLPKSDRKNIGSHVKLILQYTEYSGDKLAKNEMRKIGKVLSDCKVIRAKADYEIDQEFFYDNAETVLEYVKDVKGKLTALEK